MPPRRTPLKPARPQRTGPDRATRDLVAKRDDFRCFCCGVPLLGEPASVQHRDARGMGGTTNPLINSPANLILLAGTGTSGCHGRVERRSGDDNRLGYWLRNGQKPERTPVFHWWLGWVLLGHDGAMDPLRGAA